MKNIEILLFEGYKQKRKNWIHLIKISVTSFTRGAGFFCGEQVNIAKFEYSQNSRYT